jgi:3-hydroxybutyryl-CoA dehydrogenase
MGPSKSAEHTHKAASENLDVKQRIFGELAAETRPDTILATNTSSISITKIATSAVPQGESAASALAKSSAGRVVGKVHVVVCLHAQTIVRQGSIFSTLSQ